MPHMLPAAPPFLALFPPRHHPYVRAWFAYAVAQGAQTPEGVLQIVARVVQRKAAWSTSTTSAELCRLTLDALEAHREDALAYAQTLLARPTIPRHS